MNEKNSIYAKFELMAYRCRCLTVSPCPSDGRCEHRQRMPWPLGRMATEEKRRTSLTGVAITTGVAGVSVPLKSDRHNYSRIRRISALLWGEFLAKFSFFFQSKVADIHCALECAEQKIRRSCRWAYFNKRSCLVPFQSV